MQPISRWTAVASWLNRDGHDNYRYITLGFGNKISRLAVLTDAGSVDGEWNSGRMLPDDSEQGAAALTSSKYFGEGRARRVARDSASRRSLRSEVDLC